MNVKLVAHHVTSRIKMVNVVTDVSNFCPRRESLKMKAIWSFGTSVTAGVE